MCNCNNYYFGQLADFMWIVCDDYMFDEKLEALQACEW